MRVEGGWKKHLGRSDKCRLVRRIVLSSLPVVPEALSSCALSSAVVQVLV